MLNDVWVLFLVVTTKCSRSVLMQNWVGPVKYQTGLLLTSCSRYKWAFVGMPYGPEWKASRKLFATSKWCFYSIFTVMTRCAQCSARTITINISLKNWKRLETFYCGFMKHQNSMPNSYGSESLQFLVFSMKARFSDRYRRMAGSAILSIAYGFNANVGQNSVYTDNAERAMDGFIAAAVPGSFLVVCSVPASLPIQFCNRVYLSRIASHGWNTFLHGSLGLRSSVKVGFGRLKWRKCSMDRLIYARALR